MHTPTINYYNKQASKWSESHSEKWWEEDMETFKKYLPSGKVLDIGSGEGKVSESLLEEGYDVTGIDAAYKLLAIARKRNPKAQFVHKFIHEINPSLGSFDGFWASAVLFHLPRDRMVESLNAISSVIKDGGIGYIAIFEGKGELVDEETGRLFTFYMDSEFVNILNHSGFSVLQKNRKEFGKHIWLMYFVSKVKTEDLLNNLKKKFLT